MSDGFKTTVKFDVDIAGDIQKVINDENVMTLVQSRFAQIVDPYVPYDTGYLSQDSVEIDAEGVTYTADYAWKQYYGEEYNHNTEVHPLATAHWDKVAMQTEYATLVNDIQDIIREKLANG